MHNSLKMGKRNILPGESGENGLRRVLNKNIGPRKVSAESGDMCGVSRNVWRVSRKARLCVNGSRKRAIVCEGFTQRARRFRYVLVEQRAQR